MAEKNTESRIAIIGGESLLGREVRDVLAATHMGQNLALIAGADEAAGTLTGVGDEAAFLAKLTPGSVLDAAAIVLAGPSETSEDILELKPAGGIIDLTYVADDQPQARLRAPMLEGSSPIEKAPVYVIAHPAAIALAVLLGRLHPVFPIRRSVIQIFEPATERGQAAVEELQQQTVSLFSFKGMPKAVFDTQLAFSMLPRLGEGASFKIEEIEARIERHLASLLAMSSRAPMPSIRLIQAPVFHGYCASLWIELEHNPGLAAIEQTLAGPYVEVRGRDVEPPSNTGVAGQNEIMVGALAVDNNHPDAIWLWMATDNLRLTAQNAAMVLKDLL